MTSPRRGYLAQQDGFEVYSVPQAIQKAGQLSGERVWELPLWEEYGDLIRATYADVQNISKRYAGTITAGMFLKEFAQHTSSWAHLDIAGTAWKCRGTFAWILLYPRIQFNDANLFTKTK